MIYDNVVYIWDPLKQNLILEFSRKQNKDISVLTGTHSNYDQINQIRNNWFGPIFLLETFTQKDCLLSFIQDLKMSLRLTLIQKGDFYLSRLLSLITDFFVFVPLQGIAPESSWLKDVSLKDYKIIWKINEGNEKKNLLGNFTITTDKTDRDEDNETKDFIDIVPKVQGLHKYKNC